MSTLHRIESEIIRRHIAGNEAYLRHVSGSIRDGWLITDRNLLARGAHLERVRDIGRRRYRRFADAIWPDRRARD